MTTPSLRSMVKLLAYAFAVPGVVFVVMILAAAYNGGFTSTTPAATPSGGHFGLGTPKSERESLVEWREAAAKGNQSAKHALACALYRKAGTPEERAEALALLNELTAPTTVPDYTAGKAAAALGQIYAEGLGVPHDATKAVQYRILADQAGVIQVRVPLALAYLRGDGVAKDEVAAIRLIERQAGEFSSGGIFWEAPVAAPR